MAFVLHTIDANLITLTYTRHSSQCASLV